MSRERGTSRRRHASRVRIVVMLAVTVLAVSGCLGSDPDAEARDRASTEARRIAETVPLPPGYRRLDTKDRPAQTPEENHGGGQGGAVELHFAAPPGATLAQVLHDFDALYTGTGYIRADYAGQNLCRDGLIDMDWATPTHLVSLHYSATYDTRRSIDVPYGYHGLVTSDMSAVKKPVELPACPS
jgi:hypothetical protein